MGILFRAECVYVNTPMCMENSQSLPFSFVFWWFMRLPSSVDLEKFIFPHSVLRSISSLISIDKDDLLPSIWSYLSSFSMFGVFLSSLVANWKLLKTVNHNLFIVRLIKRQLVGIVAVSTDATAPSELQWASWLLLCLMLSMPCWIV